MVEGMPVHVLHDEVEGLLPFIEFLQHQYVRVIELSHALNFRLKGQLPFSKYLLYLTTFFDEISFINAFRGILVATIGFLLHKEHLK
jgi:hypothetical protein